MKLINLSQVDQEEKKRERERDEVDIKKIQQTGD